MYPNHTPPVALLRRFAAPRSERVLALLIIFHVTNGGHFPLTCRAADADRVPTASSPTTAAGSIEGRVFNATTGANLERARVTLDGTQLETFTDEEGRFRLASVPAGTAQVRVFYTGLAVSTQAIAVSPGETAQIDLSLSATGRKAEAGTDGAPIKLAEFVVGDSREMSGTAIAINEQRFAPNMRSVVSTDEFGDVPDGNVAEFLKFLPGVSVNSARELSINGVPSANVPISIGGFSVSSVIGSGGDGGTARSNSMDLFTTSNLSRIEVSFSPTPDSEGSALAGSVNMVPRSSFERTRPAYSVSAFVSMLNNGRDLQQKSEFRKFHPGIDFSAVVPVSKKFGYTLSGGHSVRMTDTPVIQNVRRGVNTATNGAAFPHTPFGEPYLSGHVAQSNGRKATRGSLATSVDYRFSRSDRLTFGLQYSSFDVLIDYASLTFDVGRVLPGQFSTTFTHGAAGAGTLQLGTTGSRRKNWNYMPSIVWRHDGPQWRWDMGMALSRSRNRTRNIERGVWQTTTARRTGVTVSMEDVGYYRPREITVTDATGAPIDPFDISNYVVTAAVGSMRGTDDTRHSIYGHVKRDLAGRVPLSLKTGFDVRRAIRDARGFGSSHTFLGADGRASTMPAGSDDAAMPFARESLAERISVNGFPRVPGISSEKLYDYYEANPSHFGSPDANTRYRSEVSLSSIAEEIVSAVYLRGDLPLFQNRLKLVGGVRAEQTNIDAAGPLTDPSLNIQRNAQGQPILGPNGRPLPIATDPLEASRLTYLDRAGFVKKEYLRWFPSLNASFNVRENLVARAAWYTSIGRPNFNQYSGGLTLPDLEMPPANNNRIMVNNAAIKPWSARTVNVRLEYYFSGLGQLSVGAFRREFENFFGNTTFRAEPEFLALYGLDMESYGDYDVVTQHNLSSAVRMEGTTVNYKQALTFLPSWARGVQVFGNLTVQRALGEASANFVGYVPKSGSWGASLTRKRVVVHVNWNYRGRTRRGLVATGNSIEPSTYNWGVTRLVTDVIAEYHFNKRFAFFANIRNLTHAPDELEITGPSTPPIARLRQSNADFGSLWTIGFKGKF